METWRKTPLEAGGNARARAGSVVPQGEPAKRARATSMRGEVAHRVSGSAAAPDLLDDPGVAVGVVEVQERVVVAPIRLRPGHLLARLDVPDVAGVHPAPDQFGAGGLDVGDDQVQA